MGNVARWMSGAVVTMVALTVGTYIGAGAAWSEPATITSPADAASVRGANDWSCKPTPTHPRPVILVHGTWSSASLTWNTLAPALKERGLCVFAPTYGTYQRGTAQNLLDMFGGNDIARSARELASYVTRVRRATGARQVDLVGHSQGALVARQYIAFDGGANRDPGLNPVHTMVSVAGTNHGTSFGDKQNLGAIAEALGFPVRTLASLTVGPSYVQQMTGSPFLARLNAGGDTRPGIGYVVLATRTDGVVTPPESSFLSPGPHAPVRNQWLQYGCPGARADHMSMTSAPRAVWLIADALDPAGTREPAPCS